jgi:siroheme synthase (precorrin-2 oxidase/ferrochelatase)
VPAQVKRGDLQIAISTSGKLPRLAGRLRAFFDKILPQSIGVEIDRLHQIRTGIINDSVNNPDLKKSRFEDILEPEIEDLLNNAGLK